MYYNAYWGFRQLHVLLVALGPRRRASSRDMHSLLTEGLPSIYLRFRVQGSGNRGLGMEKQ